MTSTNQRNVIAIAVLVVGLTNSALASIITYGTPNGTSVNGRPVSAQATFVSATNQITVTLRNLEVNIKDITQTLSGVSFALDNLDTGTTILSSVGQERTVNSNKTFTDGLNVPSNWQVLLDGQSMQLMLPDNIPSHTIIGPASGLTYTGANSSIAGDANNNPFLIGPVTFVISVPGVTATTHVDWATFHFGQCAQYVELCKTTPVPEPATATLAVAALVCVGTVRFRRAPRRAKQA